MKWNYDNYINFLREERKKIEDLDSMDNVIEHATRLLSETSGLGIFLRKKFPHSNSIDLLATNLRDKITISS